MLSRYFNTTFDSPNQFDPLSTPEFGSYNTTPYVPNVTDVMPQPMSGNLTATSLYPLESSTATPGLSTPLNSGGNRYASGGSVNAEQGISYPEMAEMLRRQGNSGDTMLAHINPMEAQLLQRFGGEGSINPITGLPQFKPFFKQKWFTRYVAPLATTILGNMVMPGIGGMIGGTLGGAGGAALSGERMAPAMLRGLGIGALLPSAAGLLGSGASALGMGGVGGALSSYGASNAILPALSGALGGGALGASSAMTPTVSSANTIAPYYGAAGSNAVGVSGNALGAIGAPSAAASSTGAGLSSYLGKWLEPQNVLTGVSVLGQMMNRPKEETPERIAEKEKRYRRAARLNPQELADEEAYLLAQQQAQRRIAQKKFVPEERIAIAPIRRKVNTPDEYNTRRQWIEYEPASYKTGGRVNSIADYDFEETTYPNGIGVHLSGHTKGQDDQIDASVSDGEFIMPADVVSHLGDGNNAAGAKQFYKLIEHVRAHKGMPNKLPPKSKPIGQYLRPHNPGLGQFLKAI